jgi:hypothetical protein
MAIDRLTGADASLEKAITGATLTSGTASLGQWYKIATRLNASTPSEVAAEIRAGTFTGWTLSGSGAEVIFTAAAVGVQTGANSLNVALTGVLGNFVITTPGEVAVAEVITLTITAGASAAGNVGVVIRGATAVSIAVDGPVFPAGYAVGDLWQGDGVAVFSASNSAAPVTFEVVQDCSSFSFEISADEIEVTVLVDEVKKYRKGKNDMSGSVSGINFVSEMEKAGSILNRFLRVITGTSSGSVVPTINVVDGSDFYIRALLNDSTAVGEKRVFLFGQVELYGYNLGADIGSAQTWESSIRFIGADPMVYVVENVA